MEQSERTRTIGVLSSVQNSIESAASPAEDMITYMDRLLKRLLDNVSLSWQLPHLSPPSQPTAPHLPSPSNTSHLPLGIDAFNPTNFHLSAPWDTSTAQDTIRDELWFSQLSLPPLAAPPQPGPSSAPMHGQASGTGASDMSDLHQQQPMFFPPNDDDFW
jgi:hypothetical protein